MEKYIKDGAIIVRGASITVDDKRIYNPTETQYQENGWEIYAEPEPSTYIPTYKERVISLIRQKFCADDELAILRQREEKPQEYQEYYTYVEQCKTEARRSNE